MRILKVFLVLLIVLATLQSAFADPAEDLARGSFRTTYNPFTGKQDYYRMYTGSDFCLIDGSNCAVGNGTGNGTQGPQGIPGINGTRWFVNTSFPTSKNINDTFLNTSTGVYSQWNGSSWVVKGNLSGAAGAQGIQGIQGIQGVAGVDGRNGTDGTNGTNGATGANGLDGLNGTRWFTGTAYPTGVNINDTFLNTSTYVFHQWNGSSWVLRGNLSGATGATGSQGAQGNPGVDGRNGTDGINGTNGATGPQGPAGTNGTNGLNGTSIVNVTYLVNGSMNVTLSNGQIFISGNLTGPKGDTGATGSQGPAGTNASVTSGDVYINISNGVVRANITAFDLLYYGVGNSAGYVSLPTVVSSIQNSTICHSDGTNCPSGGNSSWNQSGYWINASASFYPLRTNPQGFYNSSTIPAYVLISGLSGAVGQNLTYALITAANGNWSADKASYATNVHVANVNATALKNATVASLAGLTVTDSATVEGVLVVDPGTATAAAVRVGGPLTTYSALQFQSEQNRTRDFIFSSVNNSVASNRMAIRVSGNEAGGNSGGDLSILRFDDAGTFIDTPFKIDRSDGYVGIGDSTPDAKLDVFGDTILDGGVTISGVASVEGYRVLPSWTNYTTAQYATTSATVYTLMPTLTTTLAASHTYLVKCEFLTFSAAVTTGERLRVNTTGAPTTVTWNFNSQVSATTRTSFQGVSTSTNAFADTGSAGTNVRDITFLTGYIVTSGSASTITYEMISEVAGSNAAYDTGSRCEYKVVA